MLINSIKCLLMDIIMAGKVDPERHTKAKTMTSYKKKMSIELEVLSLSIGNGNVQGSSPQ